MRTSHVSLIALLLCFTVADVFVAPAFAQGTGQIEGVVRDEQGGVLPGATLSLRNADSGVTRTVTSESDGRYVFPALLPGRYVLRTELSGFAAQEVRDAVITIGLELRRDFTLKLQAVAETVSADAPVVDTTKAEVAGVVTRQQIETLPINSRQHLSLALLVPGTTVDATRSFFATVNVGGSMTFNGTGNVVGGTINNWTRATIARSFVAKFVVYLPAGLLSGELAAPPRNSLRPSASTRFRPTPLLVPSFA